VLAVRVWTVVVAAGTGERFGGPKQFAMLGGHPLAAWAVDAARPASAGVVLVVPADRLGAAAALGADAVVAGGSTRSESVRAGLAAVPGDAEVVVVHDGARPLATAALFRAVVAAVEQGADAAVPAVAVADTLKVVEDGTVVSTLERSGVVVVQTPQAFRAEVLRRAHASGGDATDDAGLAEAVGATVRVVPGEPANIKVTTPADLELVQGVVSR
jgi:2-C-methyl-D-erythritol 4-phosphate cytidylyltransferase